jgi:hybrid cluster-associated redox disulfide protein
MGTFALVVAVISLLVAYLAVRRTGMLNDRLSHLEADVNLARSDLSTARAQFETRLQGLHVNRQTQSSERRFLPSMTIAEAMALHSGVAGVLASFNLGSCSNCAISDVDTLEGACRSYGIDEDALMSALAKLAGSASPDLVQMAHARGRVTRN